MRKNYYEKLAWAENRVVCGIDEVGRGSLAGPVVAAAVILPIGCSYRLLKDSKLMTPEERQRACAWILRNCSYGVGVINHRLIDQHNIWQATLLAMHKAVMHLAVSTDVAPHSILIDAMPLRIKSRVYQDVPIHHFPFGESLSSSIAAASILAKVTRDKLMLSMDKLFPHFSWYSNKGYSTKQHWQALNLYEKTIVHRLSYLKNMTEGESYDQAHEQQRIC
jgi:ribonuclease HII